MRSWRKRNDEKAILDLFQTYTINVAHTTLLSHGFVSFFLLREIFRRAESDRSQPGESQFLARNRLQVASLRRRRRGGERSEPDGDFLSGRALVELDHLTGDRPFDALHIGMADALG
jgi:hypothetical protein